ncbi:hypothetical protein NQ318_008090 [Aromia moschata]|uniref:Uncharacterized protein n=1 Tax=Aromia moschata TaxID=1265417 RepID=A0AAV8YM57_9CUCU|nr:hypothetical protein NQ318_008090 [Aromia moschata]
MNKTLTKALKLRTRRLLEEEKMGDSKPSQFLRRLRALADAAVSVDLLRMRWSGCPPQSVQAIIASQKDSKLDDVAELADAVMASIAPKASVIETSSRSANQDRYARLEAQISCAFLGSVLSEVQSDVDRGDVKDALIV